MANVQVPHNLNAEEAVIGAIFIDPEEVLPQLNMIFQKGAGEFYIHRLRFIWQAVETLAAERKAIDVLTVSNRLGEVGKLDEVGGTGYLISLLNQVPSTLNVDEYAKILVETRTRRDMLEAANEIAALAYDQETPLQQAVAEATGRITAIGQQAGANDGKFAPAIFSAVYDRVDRASREPATLLPGVGTGFVDLDRYLSGGYQKKQLIYVGARPGQGKTAFLLSNLYDAAYIQRKKVALFTLEMSAEENVERLIAMEQEINGQVITTGKLGDNEWPKFTQAIENGEHAPFYVDDTPYLSPASLRAKCLHLRATWGLDLVLVDYVGLMLPDKTSRAENRNIELTNISRSLKHLANELNCPVVAAHQLSRDVEKRGDPEPNLSDLRDSGSLEQDANIVMFLYQDRDVNNQNVSHLKIAKNRSGQIGKVDFLFRREYTKFYSLARREVSL